jgi:two-component system, LytTR family, response regulator
MILRCIAIDDEVLALNKIKRFSLKTDFIKLVHTYDNAKDAIEFLKSHQVDLIFLDIEMPEISGFQFLKEIKVKPHVILTTAFDQYALKSYDFDVDDYLLKPIQYDRFLKATGKVYEIVNKDKKIEEISTNSESEKEHIYITSSGKIIKIYIDDILYIEGMKDYLSINTTNKRILTLMNFDQLLSKLPDKQFIRIHKSYIVAIHKIEQFDTNEIIIGETHIPVSRTYKKELQNIIKNF